MNNIKLDLIPCNTFFSKLRGLMFSKRKNLLFEFKTPSRYNASIHTFFVFFPIEVTWLDKNKKIIEKRLINPFRIAIPKAKARYIIEIAKKENFLKN